MIDIYCFFYKYTLNSVACPNKSTPFLFSERNRRMKILINYALGLNSDQIMRFYGS